MQRTFAFLASLKPPRQQPLGLVGKTEFPHRAIAVSLKGIKQAYIASRLDVSESYLSQLKKGKKPIPDWFVTPFCWLTGTLLLQQVIGLQEDAQSENVIVRRLADELRRAA